MRRPIAARADCRQFRIFRSAYPPVSWSQATCVPQKIQTKIRKCR